jgi:hypothetical protein
MALEIQVTQHTSFINLQDFLHGALDSELHGKRNQDGSYTLYTSKGGGTGASFCFKRSRADRQMNARAAILQVISNYKKAPEDSEIKTNFDVRFDEVQDFTIEKLNETSNEKIGADRSEKPSERIDALRDYLIQGLPSDVKNKPNIQGVAHTHGRLYAKDVESKLLPEVVTYLPK